MLGRADTSVTVLSLNRCLGTLFTNKRLHIFGIGTTESKDILVIITHCYDTHFFILMHQSLNQSEIICSHILCLIND